VHLVGYTIGIYYDERTYERRKRSKTYHEDQVTVDRNTKYFVATNQCIRIPLLLRSCYNTQRFYIIDSYR
jgi:hypothetical protein